MKWVLDAVDCLLMMESLKDDSLMEEEMHSFRGAGDRKRRQGIFSARVILTKNTATDKQPETDFIVELLNSGMWWTTAPSTTRWNDTDLNNSPVLVVDDGVDERVVDGRGFCYDCRDSLGVRRQDVGVPEMRRRNANHNFSSCSSCSVTNTECLSQLKVPVMFLYIL